MTCINCDRCGNGIMPNDRIIVYVREEDAFKRSTTYDLCKHCAKALHAWMQWKPTNGE